MLSNKNNKRLLFTFLFCLFILSPSLGFAEETPDMGTNPFADSGIEAGRIKGLIQEVFPNATHIDNKDKEKNVWPIYLAF